MTYGHALAYESLHLWSRGYKRKLSLPCYYYMYILTLSDLCPGVEEKIYKTKCIYMAIPNHKNLVPLQYSKTRLLT